MRSYKTLYEMADELNISTSAVSEIKKKLKINRRYTTEEDFMRIKKFSEAVKKEYVYVTLTTINNYLSNHWFIVANRN